MGETLEIEILALMQHDMHLDVADASADLLASGALDSLALVDLLARLERRWRITIPLGELDLDDVRSVRALAALVARQSVADQRAASRSR